MSAHCNRTIKGLQKTAFPTLFFCALFGEMHGDGVPVTESIPGTILIVEPIHASNPLLKEFRSAKNEQEFSLGYYQKNPIKLPRITRKSHRETCELFLSQLADKHANPVSYTFIEESRDGSIKYRVGISPFIQVFLWFRVEGHEAQIDKWKNVELPVGFLIAK